MKECWAASGLVGRFGRRDRAAVQCVVENDVRRLYRQGWGNDTHDQRRADAGMSAATVNVRFVPFRRRIGK